MRAIRLTCVSLGFTIATAITAGPVSAAACAEQFPFVCLFGPEAEAMQPAPPLFFTEMEEPAQPVLRRPRKRMAVHKPPTARVAEVAAVSPQVEEAKREEPPVSQPPVSLASLRLGPGPAFSMSLRLTPTMQEQVMPPSSACMIEQTFNDLFRIVPEDHNKLAENEPAPIRPLAMVSLKTGSAFGADRDEEYTAAPAVAAQNPELK
jgi:hypothetical protein